MHSFQKPGELKPYESRRDHDPATWKYLSLLYMPVSHISMFFTFPSLLLECRTLLQLVNSY